MVPDGESKMVREIWLSAWKVDRSHLNYMQKAKANRKWGKAINSKAHPDQ